MPVTIEDIAKSASDWSIEVTPAGATKIESFAGILEEGTTVNVTFLPGSDPLDTIATAKRLADDGMNAVPHIAARSLQNKEQLDDLLKRMTSEANVREVLVIGGGVVGINAARMAMGMGAQVTLADRSVKRLQEIDTLYGDRLQTVYSSRANIESLLPRTDAVIGAVLVPGAAAPKLITREMLELMQPGSVLVDVAIDQGGCFETSMPTTHQDPTFQINGIVHYCVANMPGAVARTSTLALTNVTQPFISALANQGVRQALINDPHLLAGLNVHNGLVTLQPVANAQGYEYVDPRQALAS